MNVRCDNRPSGHPTWLKLEPWNAFIGSIMSKFSSPIAKSDFCKMTGIPDPRNARLAPSPTSKKEASMIASCLRSRKSSAFDIGELNGKREPSLRERPMGLYPTATARWRGLDPPLEPPVDPPGLVTFMSRKTDK